ncbi:hypothetical protein [Novosphingobium aquimarinum]|uniref:hypothetical protein n=1 Tax=Novosphingobium aquimarinum TaxID=2682494 RepID=UPI0012EB301A|nr:hypothetical protein [Novosphingobium aquimarinum]
MKNIHGLLLVGCSALALAGCGPNELASPGTGGDIIINNPTPTPTPTPVPTPTPTSALVTPAAGCPTIAATTGLGNEGTISGPTGEYRVCTLPATFDQSSTLPYVEGVLYRMNGRVDVGSDGGPTPDDSDGLSDTNVTLTIQPGVIVYSSGSSFLYVNRGNKINATGTQTMPIVFTSRDNVQGLNNNNSSGQWGGVVLGGRAPLTDCDAPNAAEGTIECERQVEGSATPAFFGGATTDDTSGVLKYVQIRFSGFTLTGGSELQSLTTGGTGTGTQFDYIQSFNSSDDGAEFFGGYVNMKHYIAVGAEDDSIDSDTGVQLNMQYAIVVQDSDRAHDAIIEGDSNDNRNAVPRQDSKISNFVFISPTAPADAGAAVYFRGGTDYALLNGIIISPNDECIRIRHAETAQATGPDENGPPVFESVQLSCLASGQFVGSDGPTAADVQGFFDAGSNNNASYTSTLTSLFINGSNESGVTAFDPTTLSSFFDAVSYIGAVKDSSDTWYTGWTCNSDMANFGTNTGNCTSLPVY